MVASRNTNFNDKLVLEILATCHGTTGEWIYVVLLIRNSGIA
jgi:hypothetical protein